MTNNSKMIPMKSFADTLDEVQDVCFDLLSANPFYGHILASLNRQLVEDEKQLEPTEMKTLGLSTVKLSLNYPLWAPLSETQKRDRLQHEVLHFVFLHPWKDKPKNIGLFYTACDISANMYCNDKLSLRLSNFEKLCNRHGVSIDSSDGYVSIYNSLVSLWRKIPTNIMKKHNMVKEDYEAELLLHQQNALEGKFFDPGTSDLNEAIAMFPQTSTGDCNVSGLSSLLDAMKKAGASQEEINAAIQNFLQQNTDPWEAVAEGTSSTAAEDLVKRILSDSKSRGDVPGGLQEYVDILLTPPKIDWRRELRNFTKRAGKVAMSSTMSRRSKRYKTFPSGRIKRLQKIAIAVDTSGSMSDEEFNQAISEVRGALIANCQVIVIQADCVVDDVQVYDRKLPDIGRISRFGNGGTSFDDALKYIKTGGRLDIHSEFPSIGRVDGIVYITDGYAPAPEKDSYPNCKLLWLTSQKPVEQMEREGFRGRIVFIDPEDV
jgi:predicted metal-dependent peptidase